MTCGSGIDFPVMTWRLLAAISLVGLIAGTTNAASADIYRCRRSNGVHHYTNIKEPGRRCELVVRGSKQSKRKATHGNGGSAVKTRSNGGSKDSTHSRYDTLIDEAASLYQLPHSFIRAVMRVESGFNPTVVSSAGAMGLMQLMPKTARSMGVADPFDVRQNILGGARYLRILANRFKGDLVLTVAAYNAGEGAIEKHNGIPPYRETQRYVRRVLKHYYAYRGDGTP